MAESTRIHAPDKELVPRAMVRLMFGLVMLCLLMVSAHVWTGQPVVSAPPDSAIKVEKTLFLQGEMSGAARVLDANGSVIADLSPEQGGFLSGVWRVLQRERTKARTALDGPVIVQAFDNGRMAITDPSTGWSADLMGFGQDNAAAFAKLLID
ncbi:photosynthetic complex assembly protein PuhC [Thalassococcus lentus]|uniref:Photosynthetic complex assembly protein PuhC n=1 Tax=Thalassococcus lentus TaxID=1210524 RepID=A0ABT4XN32_9RHOB|nr:photosynthetic complex assembly protein PuhC [Thalassococcus lentus]MDA7423353.1 photosynthetic complex assembly protein PuhC [Thalassococcus lentus]